MSRHAFVNVVAGIQWLGFMFANTVVIPLSVGTAFHQTPEAIAGAMARSFLITGLACLIQVFFGHRFPLMEGQSGMWWGVILGLAQLGTASGIPMVMLGGSVSVGIFLGGLVVMVCGALGMHRVLNRLFTPVVMAVLLFLLAAQLIDIFFKGMMGVSQYGHIQSPVALLSIGLVVLVSALTIWGRGLLSNFSILIGLATGWIAYVLQFGAGTAMVQPKWQDIAQAFSWGAPHFQRGILVTCMVTALLNTTNTVATLRAAEPLFHRPLSASDYQRSLVLSGLFTAVSGPLTLVPYAPYTSSIGFLRTTRLFSRTPFIIGAAMFTLFGFIPPLSGFFSTLPISVGDAVLFVAYLQLFGSALNNLDGLTFDFRSIFRIALPILVGLAIQSMPSDDFSTLPGYVQPLLGNGMLMGILLSIVLETFPWEKMKQASA